MRTAPRSYNIVFVWLSVSAVASALSQTMIVPAMPAIQDQTGATTVAVTWVMTAYTLVGAVCTPLAARLGRMFGNRRVLVLLTLCYLIGSLVAMLGTEASSLPLLLVGRCLQGLAAGVLPLTFAIIREEAPPEKASISVVMISSMLAFGGSIGLPVGGLLIDHLGVSWIFGVGAGLALISLLAVQLYVPESRNTQPGRLDLIGAALLSASLASMLLVLTNGRSWGWTSPAVLLLAVLGPLAMAVFVRYERSRREPLLELSVLSEPVVFRANVVTFLLGYGVWGSFFLLPMLAQVDSGIGGLGLTATAAGLIAAPVAVANFLISPVFGFADKRFGARGPVLIGCLLAALAMALVALFPGSLIPLLIASFLWGVGFATSQAGVSNMVFQAVRPEHTGEAIAVNAIVRNMGSAVGTQVGGALITVFALGPRPLVAYVIMFGSCAAACVAAAITCTSIREPRREVAVGEAALQS